MVRGKIVDAAETPQQLLDRVIRTLFSVESEFGTSLSDTQCLAEEFARYMVERYVTPGTPTLTNAGRIKSAALSSCVIIPVDLSAKDSAATRITSYYRQNMGSGFDFTPYPDPVALLRWIDELSEQETQTGLYERYIGNMGSLHVSHPRVGEFIDAKSEDGVLRHFNISVDLSDEFMGAVFAGSPFTLVDGSKVEARAILHKIAGNAWKTGDPGILFLQRMNRDNPLSDTEPYISTPPCGEMGLVEGETCQFAYLNLARFVRSGTIDYETIARVVILTTRVLDNAIEYSIPRYPTNRSSHIAMLKRKIGIGVCGLADLLIILGIPYDSHEGRTLARDVLSFVTYHSKLASVELAEQRGPCLAMLDRARNRYYTTRLLEQKYCGRPTNTVTAMDWHQLSERIRDTGLLRNLLTTALPPAGRSSLLLNSTSSIEPIFNIYMAEGEINQSIVRFLQEKAQSGAAEAIKGAHALGTFQLSPSLPPHIREVLKTATEVSVFGHLAMVGELAGIYGVVDEAAAKTVNLPHSATIEDVEQILLLAYRMGLKNIAIYRDQSKAGQPENLRGGIGESG